MLLKCCTQHTSKFGKLSSGHRTGKGQFSFQSQRKVMPKNVETTAQLHSSQFRTSFESFLQPMRHSPILMIFPRSCIIILALPVLFTVQWLSHVHVFATPWTAARQASLSFTISWSLLRLMSISSSVTHFSSCPQSFPTSGSFPVSRLFTSGSQRIGASASASVLPMNIQA